MKQTLVFSIVCLLTLDVQAQINTSVVSQTGNAQSATAVQAGSANELIIRQLTGSSGVTNIGNRATTTQTAVGTGPETNQAFINQVDGSFYNTATITQQTGSGNSATIDQASNSGGSQLYGTSSGPSAGNRAAISQTGANNRQVLIRQNGDVLGVSQANQASIVQIGSLMDGNGVLGGTVIEQSNLSVGNSASIAQGTLGGAATMNTATLLQNDDSQRNTASIVQDGDNKTANLQQTGLSADNQASIRQYGGIGDATILQNLESASNQATLTQTATAQGLNTGSIFQTTGSYSNRATLEQAGQDGTALITQGTASANNDALIQQGVSGSGNVASIEQTYAFDGASAGSSTVLGSGNSATISQNQTSASSTGNVAVIQQGFTDGLSIVTGQLVYSDDNRASIEQEGDQNTAQMIQGGVGNRAAVRQSGNNNVLKGVDTDPLFPTEIAGQFGNQNVMTVMQTGGVQPNIANVTQIGTGNVSAVGQTQP